VILKNNKSENVFLHFYVLFRRGVKKKTSKKGKMTKKILKMRIGETKENPCVTSRKKFEVIRKSGNKKKKAFTTTDSDVLRFLTACRGLATNF